jgi:hypothetical protein
MQPENKYIECLEKVKNRDNNKEKSRAAMDNNTMNRKLLQQMNQHT